MNRFVLAVATFVLALPGAPVVAPAVAADDPAPVSWRSVAVDKHFRSEGAAVADVNKDGKPDILVGDFWYEAPNWTRHEVTTPGDYGDGAGGYSDAFLCFASDVNRDGWMDEVVIDTPGVPCHWFENPKGQSGHWAKHLICPSACNETTLFEDLFRDGRPVLIMGTQPAGKMDQGQMAWFAPGSDPDQPWALHPISPPSTPGHEIPGTQRYSHGLGVGDLNGDGRLDVLCTGGWWEQPSVARESDQPWPFHTANLGEAAAHLQVMDVDGDGLSDVVSSSAHAYGIWWFRQSKGASGEVSFERHDLFPHLTSETHALQQVDIDGDGLNDLVTGKRFWAHGPKGDPGAAEPALLYWLQARRGSDGKLTFTPRLIHDDSGLGLHVAISDVNGDGAPDVVVSNKKGVYYHEQVRPKAR